MDVNSVSNSFAMWIACAIPVLLVIAQAAIFCKKAFAGGEKVGLTKAQMKEAVRSSAITSIGPSVVILTGMLTLLITVGGPMAWMRLSLIGSVMFEAAAAGIGTMQAGVTLGVDTMTLEALTLAVWTMILGSIGWVLFSTITANRMDKIQQKISGGSGAVMIGIASAAIIGVFASSTAGNIIKMDKNTVSCVVGGVVMAIMILITNKLQAKRLAEWNLTIAIIAALLVTAFIG